MQGREQERLDEVVRYGEEGVCRMRKLIPLFKVFMAPFAPDDVANVLTSGFIGQGKVAERFERVLREHLRMPILITNSCTGAIEMVLTYLGVGPGDEVITTPLTCVATNAPIVHLGARPVWADVYPNTGNIDPASVAKRITPRTKAIIAVDWTGRRADYTRLRMVAGNIPIIQDAAHGPLLNPSEAHGDYVCFSYGPIKHLTSGDGGGIATFNGEAMAALRLLRWYGLDRESRHDFRCAQDIRKPGMKWHMNDINAAIGIANMSGLEGRIRLHRENAYELYHRLLASEESLPDLMIPAYDDQSNYWVFPIRVYPPLREAFREYLAENGIESSQVHARNDKHSGYHYPSGDLPGLDEFDASQLNLPCGWWVTALDIDHIVKTIREWRP
jgi:dTDP-4-amino-4,6-dideoxygalactose transaminase